MSYERVLLIGRAPSSHICPSTHDTSRCSRAVSLQRVNGASDVVVFSVSGQHSAQRERKSFYIIIIIIIIIMISNINVDLTGFRDWKIRRQFIIILLPITDTIIIIYTHSSKHFLRRFVSFEKSIDTNRLIALHTESITTRIHKIYITYNNITMVIFNLLRF